MKDKRKILFVIPSLFGGGAERVFTHLINNLDRERYEPLLALGTLRGAFLEKLNADVKIYEIKAERARKAVPALVKLVWSLRPQVVFSTLGMNFATTFAKPLFPPKTRVVVREGSSPTAFLADVARQSPARAYFYRKVYRYVYNFADVVICQSDFMKRDYNENLRVPAQKLHRIYNPVNIAEIDSLTQQKTRLYKGAGPHLVTVGRLAYEKAYDNLLRAFAIVHGKIPSATLTFVGEGDDKNDLEKLTLELQLDSDSIRFIGFQSNPYPYLKQADLFVSSSRYEGFSNVMVEALACGTPVIATDCPSANREVLIEGVNGWFAGNENVASLAETINRAIIERKNMNFQAIRQSCQSRFAIEQILPQYEKQFEE